MALQSSGAISISQINAELNSGSYSLRTLSGEAGFSTPDAMSEFYGYTSSLFEYISGTVQYVSGTGRDSGDKYKVGLLLTGDGQQLSSIHRYAFANTATMNIQISTVSEDSSFILYQSTSSTGPWTNRLVANNFYGNPVSASLDFYNNGRFLRFELDIQGGSENIFYDRILYIWRT